MLSTDRLRREGYLFASRWFNNAENIWDLHKTEKNKNISSKDYINWQNKLTDQDLNAPFLVIYNSSAKDANATVVVRADYDLEFIVESVTYVFYTYLKEEAFYLSAILNSRVPNEMMKDFQARGLFGARHVHKKILDMYYPKYDNSIKQHTELSLLSETAHIKAKAFMETQSTSNISNLALGRLRLGIKKHIEIEMTQIDKIVKKIINN